MAKGTASACSATLCGRIREKLYTATKVPPKHRLWPSRRGDRLEDVFPAEYIREYTEKSLANLGLSSVDLLQFHVWEDDWTDKRWQRAVDDLKREGLTQAIGISINRWEPWNGVRTLRTGLIDAVQVIYNIFDQAPEERLFPACQRVGASVIARVPFDEGSLTGTMTVDDTWPEGDWRNLSEARQAADDPGARETLRPLVPPGKLAADLALRFILHHPAVSTTIPGMRALPSRRGQHRGQRCAAPTQPWRRCGPPLATGLADPMTHPGSPREQDTARGVQRRRHRHHHHHHGPGAEGPARDGRAALRPLVPIFLAYVLSFVNLGIYWNNHHHMLHACERISGGILWANLHLLFWLSLVPFATGWMGENHFAALPTAVYGGVMFPVRHRLHGPAAHAGRPPARIRPGRGHAQQDGGLLFPLGLRRAILLAFHEQVDLPSPLRHHHPDLSWACSHQMSPSWRPGTSILIPGRHREMPPPSTIAQVQRSGLEAISPLAPVAILSPRPPPLPPPSPPASMCRLRALQAPRRRQRTPAAPPKKDEPKERSGRPGDRRPPTSLAGIPPAGFAGGRPETWPPP